MKFKKSIGKIKISRKIDLVKQERNKCIIKKFLSGATLEETGKEFGLTREMVRQILKNQNIHS